MSDTDTSIAIAKLSYKQAVAVAMVSAAAAVISTVIGSAEVRGALSEGLTNQKPVVREPSRVPARPPALSDSSIHTGVPVTVNDDTPVRITSDSSQQLVVQDHILSDEVNSLRHDRLELERQITTATSERDQARAEVTAATTTIAQLQSEKNAAEATATRTAAELDDAHGKLAASQTTLAAMRRDNDSLRIQLKARTVKIEDRPSLYSAFSSADLSASECLSRGEQIATRLGGSITQKDTNALFLSNGRYTWAVQCVASSRLVSVVIAGPDIDLARRWGDQFRADFLATGN